MLPRLRRRINAVVQSPWFISLIASLVILPFLRVDPKPYTLHVESEESLHPGNQNWYEDLDNDGVPEQITLLDHQNGAGLMVRNGHSFIEQWNIAGDFSFFNTQTLFITGDTDGDGSKEIYLFSLAGDSILLHTIPDFRKPSFGVHNRLIARASPGNKRPDPYIIRADMQDLNGDGRKELIFGITSGFSLYPRNIYAYFPDRDSLIISPPSCIPFIDILQADIDGDGNDEILLHSAAPSNCDPLQHPLHDHSSWLVILDNHLQFKQAPHEYPSRYSLFTPLFHSGSGGSQRSPNSSNRTLPAGSGSSGAALSSGGSGGSPLFAGYLWVRQPGESSWLWRYDTRGIATDSAAIASGGWRAFVVEEKMRGGEIQLRIAILMTTGSIDLYNEQLNHIRTIGPSGYSYPVTKLDIDGDGEQELIIPSNNSKNLAVFRKGLKQPASLSQELSSAGFLLQGIAADKGGEPLLSVVSGDQQYMLRYEKNRLYMLGYGVYPGVYGGMMLFALMVQRVQRRKMQQQYITEKQIAGLQLNLIRNQIDPHFTMNVLNSIIYSVKTQDPDTASDNLMRFSDLYRNMLLTAGEIRRSLDSELAFCDDYLALERMRFGGKFDYSIEVGEDVDREVMVPKMAVQVFAENAVKHGIAKLKSGGMIRIGAAMEGPWLVMTVQDNGVGRERARQLGSQSTGKGLQLTEDFFDVYKKYYHQEIVWEVRDLEDEVQGLEDEEDRDLKDAEMRDLEMRDLEDEQNGRTGTLVEIRILNPVVSSLG